MSTILISKYTKIEIYRAIILSIVLYGCETWSLILMEERGLRVFENRMLRGIFGPKRDEVTGEWRKLHNQEFNVLYSSPNIIAVIKSSRLEWAGHVALKGGEVHAGFWWSNMGERDHLKEIGIDGRIILRRTFR